MSTVTASGPAAARAGTARTVRARRSGFERGLGACLAVAAVACSVAGTVLHFVPGRSSALIAAAAFAPVLMVPATGALAGLVLARWWKAAAVTSAVVLASVLTQVPLYTASRAPAGGRTVTMLTANLHLGTADPAALVAQLRAHDVELFTAQELTAAEDSALARAGIGELLPYHFADARPLASGVGLWSRYPISDAHSVTGYELAFVAARVAVPGMTTGVVVAAAHMPGPWPQSPVKWRADIARLPSTLSTLATAAGRSGTVLLGADMNATVDNAQYRSVLRHGFADAARQAGAGSVPTYPADRALPPVIAIDHVITSGATATGVRSVPIRNSDHRGLLATLALPA